MVSNFQIIDSKRHLFWGALALGLLASPASADSLSLEQAVSHAHKHSTRLKIADLEIETSDARRKQARGHLGPRLQLELSAAKFDEAPGIGGGGGIDADQLGGLKALAGADPFDNAMLSVFTGLPEMFKSEAYNVDLTARVVQPLTPLWAIYQRYKLSALGVDLARVVKRRQADDLRFKVHQSYLQALQADAAVRALTKAIESVKAHEEQARHFVEAELISRVQLLQAQARLAKLQGQLASADNGASLARARLAMLINWPVSKPLPRLQIPRSLKRYQRPALRQVLSTARRHRPEYAELKIRGQQAHRGVKASWQGYLPQLNLVGAYSHNEGSIMAPPTWTGALALSWDVWEWGASHYKVVEARHARSKVALAREELSRSIALQVRAAWLKLTEADKRIAAARSGLTHAAEQLRLERARFTAQKSTSTEVLDAQMRLTQAQVEQESAHYDYLIARAALRRATGGD